MSVKLSLVITILLLTFSCSTFKGVETSPKKVPIKAEYKETDVEDVEEAKANLKANKDKRIELIQKGVDRAERFEPLIISLIAFHEYDQEITLADVSPFIAELPHIASISTYAEKQDFIKIGAEDGMSVKKLESEADKGVKNNEAVKKLKKENAELQKKLDSRVTEKTSEIAEKFFYLGGLLFIGSIFTSFSFIAAIAGKLKNGGIGLLFVGGLIMLLGTFTDFIREFLACRGELLLLLLLVPLILLFIGKKTDKAIEEIKD